MVTHVVHTHGSLINVGLQRIVAVGLSTEEHRSNLSLSGPHTTQRRTHQLGQHSSSLGLFGGHSDKKEVGKKEGRKRARVGGEQLIGGLAAEGCRKSTKGTHKKGLQFENPEKIDGSCVCVLGVACPLACQGAADQWTLLVTWIWTVLESPKCLTCLLRCL